MISNFIKTFEVIKKSLSGTTIEPTWVKNASQVDGKIRSEKIDIVIIDFNLKKENSIKLCNKIRSYDPILPIIFLNSNSDTSQKVLGFTAGADDYIVLPFSPIEFNARVEARIRKAELIKNQTNNSKWKEIEISKDKQEVKVLQRDKMKKVSLTSLEFKLLMTFIKSPNAVITRNSLLKSAWGDNIKVYSRSVDTHVSKLRRKLGPASHIIKSVRGSGYKFTPSALI